MTACSSTGYPALFHAGALLESDALQSLSLVRSRVASRRRAAFLPLASAGTPARPVKAVSAPLSPARRVRQHLAMGW
jgi:hypothetical protein